MKLAIIAAITASLSLGIGITTRGRADACSRDALRGLSGFEVLPADGTTAPANAKIWISSHRWGEHLPLAAPLTLERAGVGVPVTVQEIAVAGELTTTLYVLTPQAVLAPGDTIEVFGIIDAQKQRLSRFQITADADTTPPALPALAAIEIASAYAGGFSCGNPATIALQVAEPAGLLFLIRPDVATGALPPSALAVSATEWVTASRIEAGEQAVAYLAVDLAGNLSERSEPIIVTVPPAVSGCDASTGGPGWALVVGSGASAAAMWRRRRRGAKRGAARAGRSVAGC